MDSRSVMERISRIVKMVSTDDSKRELFIAADLPILYLNGRPFWQMKTREVQDGKNIAAGAARLVFLSVDCD